MVPGRGVVEVCTYVVCPKGICTVELSSYIVSLPVGDLRIEGLNNSKRLCLLWYSDSILHGCLALSLQLDAGNKLAGDGYMPQWHAHCMQHIHSYVSQHCCNRSTYNIICTRCLQLRKE